MATNRGNFHGGDPRLEDTVEAHLSIRGDVGMVDFCVECEMRRLERIVGGDGNFHGKYASLIRTSLRANNVGHPLQHVVANRTSAHLKRLMLENIGNPKSVAKV